MKKIILGCSLAMSMAFFSCDSAKKASVTMDELTQSAWKLESMNNVVNPAYSEGDHFTLSFSAADSTISGVGACNRYFGKMKFEKDGEVDINMGGATMMACPGLDLEQAFFKTMEEADDMKIVNGSLVMYDDKKEIAKFVPYTVIADDAHNAANSLDYWGTYTGTFPAADCPGINVTLTLNQDSTYTCAMDYIDRNSKFSEQGKYTVDKNTLILTSDKDTTYYKVGENRLMRLDNQGNPITGDMASKYELNKEVK